jgi:exopolysaccharide biosynthesis polyprenyl glycosylphosphotransferase
VNEADDQTTRLPRQYGAPRQGGTRVTVPESDLPDGRDDDRLSAVPGATQPTGSTNAFDFRAAGLAADGGERRANGSARGPVNGYGRGHVNGAINGSAQRPGAGTEGGHLPPAVPAPSSRPASTWPSTPQDGAAPIGSVSGVRTGWQQPTATLAAPAIPSGVSTAFDGEPDLLAAVTGPTETWRPAEHGSARMGARRANRPVRSAASAAAVVARPAWVFGGWLLRDGVRPLLLASDITACGIATITIAVTAHASPHWTVLLFGLLLTGLYGIGGLYRSRLSLSLLDDIPAIVERWLAALALTVLVQSARARADWGTEDVSWSMVATAINALILLLILRALAYNFVRVVRRQRRVAHRTLVLGAGHVGEQLTRNLLQHAEYGLQPIGFVDNHPLVDPETCAVPLLGGIEDLADILGSQDVRNVVIAFGSVRESEMVDIIRTCDRLRCEIFLIPRLFELHQVGADMDTVWGLPLVRLRRATYRSYGWRVKRVFDILFSLGALLILSPLMIAAAIAVRLEGGPGILFRQERVGADSRRFEVLKFRSLKPANDEESATNWNIKHDDRLGPVGKLLRKTSIDELPQLLNILRGEMTLVGPRPERPHFVAQFRQAYPRYIARHRVPSGLTGWAAVHGLRGDTSIADRAMFDNYYIENWSLWLDVKILIRTVGSVVKGQGG